MSNGQTREGEHGGAITALVSLAFVAALCLALYFARRPLLRFVAESWVVDEPAAHADALVVLSDDNFYADRATHAAELFREGVAPLIVASGRRLRPNAAISELMEHDLIERGVPKEKIVRLQHDADNTREEAGAVAKLAQERRWKSMVVVTSNYHTRRALYIFRRVLPEAVSVSVASARDGDFDPERWWEKRLSVKLFVRELAGLVVAVWELRGGGEQVGKRARLGELAKRECVDVIGTSPAEKTLLALYNL